MLGGDGEAVIHYPDPRLRERSTEVEEVTDEMRKRIETLWPVMYEQGGIGLAAPQVGWMVRLFLMNLAGESDEGEEVCFVNPVVQSKRGIEVDEEGCLSLPNVHGAVARPKKIVVTGKTLDGDEIEVEAEGLAARCILHELDHLDGKLIIDHFSEQDQRKNAGAIENLERAFADRPRVESEAEAEGEPAPQ